MAIKIERSCSNCESNFVSKELKKCTKCEALKSFYLRSYDEDVTCEDKRYPLWKPHKQSVSIADNPDVLCSLDRVVIEAQTTKDYNEFKHYSVCIEDIIRHCYKFRQALCSYVIENPRVATEPFIKRELEALEELIESAKNSGLSYNVQRIVDLDVITERVKTYAGENKLYVYFKYTLTWSGKPFVVAIFTINLGSLPISVELS